MHLHDELTTDLQTAVNYSMETGDSLQACFEESGKYVLLMQTIYHPMLLIFYSESFI